MTGEARDDYGLTEPERYETLLQTMGDHHEGTHDWSSVDPYDCVVCHAVIALYTEVVRANAAQQPDDALRVAARALVSAYTGSNHYYMLAGVRSKREAQVLGAILYELWMGNYDGAHQCLAALRS